MRWNSRWTGYLIFWAVATWFIGVAVIGFSIDGRADPVVFALRSLLLLMVFSGLPLAIRVAVIALRIEPSGNTIKA